MSSRQRVLRKRLLSGAAAAKGIAVVIDVLRAFSSAAYMMHLGAKEIVLLWLASLGMIITAIVLVSQSPSRSRWVFVACGVICLMLNVWAVAILLWIATVSSGGV